MTPKRAQGEPKVSPRRSEGAKVDAEERQNMKKVIVQNHSKTTGFHSKNKDLEVTFGPCWLMLGHLGSMLVHFGSS
jgi:hypothetical protein